MSSISQLLTPHIKDLGGFKARRSLPHEDRTTVGSFIFFDHLDLAVFPPGRIDVRPYKRASPTIYLDLVFAPQARFVLSDRERAIYSVSSGILIDREPL